MSSKKVIIKKKPKRVIQGRSFKLIDFRIFDGNKESDSSGEDSDKPKGSPNFHIQMFGINETGETCMMSVNNYLPFFYVKVGRTWNKDDAQELLQHIRQ